MFSINDYEETIKLLLSEGGKYLSLLAVAVVAIRLWRRISQVSGANRQQTLVLAVVATAGAVCIGYFSICHSLGRMYRSYAFRAFYRGNLEGARVLFSTSRGYWKSADACGGEGICLLLEDKPVEAMRCLNLASALRKGYSSGFEAHYRGVYYFFHGESEKALPCLQAASNFPEYRWPAEKLAAIILLDQGKAMEAAGRMEPFAGMEVKECDYAYILASLKLLQNKPVEARALLEKFPDSDLTDFWKPRFAKLRTKV
jgi:hypothetical protein